MAQLLEKFPADLYFAYRHFPLTGTPEQPFHDKAALATQAAEAAGLQGKFWEMHDFLFAKQGEWSSLSIDQFKEWLVASAPTLDLDQKQFEADLVSQPLVDLAQTAWENGSTTGIPGTPFVVLNGQIWPTDLPMTASNLETVIRLDLLEKRQFTTCPPMEIDTDQQYQAILHTVKGDIVLELYPQRAPLAVNSFIFLARNGWFDNVTFHRVIPGFVAQAGDPSGTGYGTPGYAFKNEISPDLKFDKPGILAMANAGADSNGSQFFITLAAAPNLDGDYTIFGQVLEGMDVVLELTPRDPSQTLDLPEGDKILAVEIK